jgi:hypothetical protein
MPRFRPRTETVVRPVGDIATSLDNVFRPAHFYIAPELPVAWRLGIEETIPWEIYHGRLLPPGQTRARRTFRAWNLLPATDPDDADAVLVALKWDVERREIHVVRGLECFVWEAAASTGNVVEGGETRRWIQELVGTIALADFTDEEELRDELICRLWQAVVGTSRLPLTSLEAPLPAFALGQLAYVYQPGTAENESIRGWRDLKDRAWDLDLSARERAKLLETIIRALTSDEAFEAAQGFAPVPVDMGRVLSVLFNDVSLSPWTEFAESALNFIQGLDWTKLEETQVLSGLLLKLCRHLNAYDLVTFHHRGANFPDALLLDLLFKRLLKWIEREPEFFLEPREFLDATGFPQSWALLHGALLRRRYQDHAVPQAPTSPGENARVLPARFPHVPDEELFHREARERRLFSGEPLESLFTETSRRVFRSCLNDFSLIEARLELGKAIFVDRPLGFGKEKMEPDQTPLLAHSAFSFDLAARRMNALASLTTELGINLPEGWEDWQKSIPCLPIVSRWPISRFASLDRPVASLADAQRVAKDYFVLGTLHGSLRRFFSLFEWEPLQKQFSLTWLSQSECMVCSRRIWSAGRNGMTIENNWGKRVDFESDPSRGFRCRGGVELPVAGLRIWRLLDDEGVCRDFREQEVKVLPRW